MTPPSASAPHFVVATPGRTVCDDNARALEQVGHLRLMALGTRHGTVGVSLERTRLNPAVGLAAYLAAKTLPPFIAESFRFGLLPWFDRWVLRHLQPGDHIISSYGYANRSFAWVREHGGKTFIDAGNTHPEHYWRIVGEEYARWHCPLPPFPRNWYMRSLAMMPLVDYVLAPSEHVRRTFLEHGFRPGQILRNVYPLDLDLFTPSPTPRPADRPLTLISTGVPSLRKGTPYLLEAFRNLRKSHHKARLLLTGPPHPSLKPLMNRWNDLPIDWAPSLPHSQLVERLRGADIFVLPSLEEGLARTACEAMACGLPVVLTPNTGASDLVVPGTNGEIVPIRDSAAIVTAVENCFARLRQQGPPANTELKERLSFARFAGEFLATLEKLGLLAGSPPTA